jgi:gas vesicle protein
MQQALYEMGSFGPGMVNAFKQIAVTSAKAANALYKFAVVAGSGVAFAAGKFTTGIDLLGKAFDDLIDVDALGASFDNFALGIQNMGSASDYSSFAAKQLAENAQSAAEATDELSGVGTGKGATAAADKLKKMEQATKDAAAALTDRMNKALDDAKDKLKDAQSAFDDFAKGTSTSLLEAFNFTDAMKEGAETGKGFVSGLVTIADRAVLFTDKIKQLVTAGLSEDALGMVLAAGQEAGTYIADELINGGATAIEQTNQLVNSAKGAADLIAQMAADKFYGAGVSNAQSYLKGIEDAFNLAQSKLQGKGLTLADVKGISAGFDNAVNGGALAPIARPNTNFGEPIRGYNYYINVHGVMTNAETGEAIINNIRAYNRAAGPANIQVA